MTKRFTAEGRRRGEDKRRKPKTGEAEIAGERSFLVEVTSIVEIDSDGRK